jgi:hypothetical protein
MLINSKSKESYFSKISATAGRSLASLGMTWGVTQLVASTPNVQSIDLTGCLHIPADDATSIQAQLPSAKTLHP